MADTIGQFLNISTVKHSDEKPAPIQPAPPLSLTATIPFEPAPPLSITASIPFEPAPALSLTASVPFQKNPNLSIPATIPFEPAPILTEPVEVAFQKPPVLSVTASQPFQPAPTHTVPVPVEFQPAPALSNPVEVPFEKPPTLSIPTDPPEMLSPTLSTPEVVPFEPPPVLSITGALPDMPPPTLSKPGDPPVMAVPSLSTPGELPKMLAPPLSSPTEIQLSPPPVLDQIHHPWTSDDAPMGNPLDADNHDHPGKQQVVFQLRAPQYMPDLPYYVFSDTQWHETVVMGAEQRKNTLAGFAYATGEAAFAALQSLHLDTNIAGFDFSFGAGGFSTNFNPQRIAENVRNIAISSIKGAAQGVLTQVGIGISNFFNPMASATSYSPTRLPDVYVMPIDYVFTYHADARAWQQNLQQRQASENDFNMSFYMGGNGFNDREIGTSEIFKNGVWQNWQADSGLQRAFGSDLQTVSGPPLPGDSPLQTIPSAFNHTPLENATPEDELGRSSTEIADEQTVIPLVFTDMRVPDKLVYFQPFITSLSEQITPRWNLTNYFGRVDPVATYQNTGRTISLGFKLVAFSREDLNTIFMKLGWLNSMCYPEYEDQMYKSGPIIRMRIGDLISTTNRGLTGVITNLSTTYSQAIWELDVNAKLPRNIEVNLTFQVLHENPIGLGPSISDAGQKAFGGIDSQGQARITAFRAAMGPIDYLDPEGGQVLDSGQLSEYVPGGTSTPGGPQTAASLGWVDELPDLYSLVGR